MTNETESKTTKEPKFRLGNPQGYNADMLYCGTEVVAQVSGIPLHTTAEEWSEIKGDKRWKEAGKNADELLRILNSHADLVAALSDLLEEYEDRRAQWGSEYLREKHEHPEVITAARLALQSARP